MRHQASQPGLRWIGRFGGRHAESECRLHDQERSEEHTSELQSLAYLVCRLLLEKKKCTAGYKAIWSKQDGFPKPVYFAALDPAFGSIVDDKMSRDIRSIGECACGLSSEAAACTEEYLRCGNAWEGCRAWRPS